MATWWQELLGENDEAKEARHSRSFYDVADSDPVVTSWLENLMKSVGTSVKATDTRVKREKREADAARKVAKTAPKKTAPRQSTGGMGAVPAYVDPRNDFVKALMQQQDGFDPNTKEFRKSRQKQINSALLASRAPWDRAIVEARQNLGGATTAIDRAAAGVDPVMMGTAKGQEMLAQSDRANIDAARDATLLKQHQDQAAMARQLGITEEQTGEAAALSNAVTTNHAAAQNGDVDRRTDASKGLASNIAAVSKLQAQEAKTGAIRDTNREVGRLQTQRATSMATARGSVESQIAEFIREQAGAASDSNLERMKMAMGMANAISGDAIKREGIQATAMNGEANRRAAAARATASTQMDPLKIMELLTGASSKTVNLGDGKYAPAFQPGQIDSMAQFLGLQGNPLAPPAPAPSGGFGGINGYISSLLGPRR